ncbi:hypothetical protein ACQEVZ_41870 [Dactylosporangium sp. CA-152071]|uniref:hypothetical protein n=1 Tax=Dactylosporangium sp. CA-152071 TaxID=3239933 RepID=UPI003D8DA9BD
MTHGPARLRAVVHHAPSCRVLRPRSPVALTVRSPLARHGEGRLTGSRAALVLFGAWCRVAAVSPHSVVHLPLEGPDLVLARSDTGLRPSAWKGMRAALSPGRPATLRSPAPRPSPGDDGALSVTEHAATLFLLGPPRALFQLGDAVTDATADVPHLRDVRRYGEAFLLGLTDLDMDVLVRDERYRRRH